MAKLVVSSFLGMRPRIGPRLLEDSIATQAVDARARSGYLRGRASDLKLGDLATPAKSVYRIIDPAGAQSFLEFGTVHVDVVRAPLVNDAYDRYYWAGVGIPPSFNTLARIQNGDPAYRLGLPRPDGAPVLTPSGGTAENEEDRAYVYTYVDEYGHESAPSDPELTTVKTDGQVDVTVVAPPADADRPTVTAIRIYRTVPGTTGTAFFYAGEMAADQTVYADTDGSDAVALNETLPVTRWFPPPDDMKGMAVMPNGFLVGFRGKDILFSEPYRPHAWPPGYTLSVEDEIVGIAVFDSNVAIMTTGSPYVASGTDPAAMSLMRMGASNACVSRRSIVSMPGAVLYASEDGIVSVSLGGHQLISGGIVDSDSWRTEFKPASLVAARDGDATYVAFFTPTLGFELDFNEPERGLVLLSSERPVTGFNQDAEGRRALLISDTEVFIFAQTGTEPVSYIWRSKEFYMTRPINLGAAQINADESPQVVLDLPVIPPQPDDPDVPLELPEQDPIVNEVEPRLFFALYADGRLVYQQFVIPNRMFRLPSGYKAQMFQFELSGTMPVSRVMLAETGKELEDV